MVLTFAAAIAKQKLVNNCTSCPLSSIVNVRYPVRWQWMTLSVYPQSDLYYANDSLSRDKHSIAARLQRHVVLLDGVDFKRGLQRVRFLPGHQRRLNRTPAVSPTKSTLQWQVPNILSTYLQYFDTVGWVFWPVKTVSHITYIILCWRGRKTLHNHTEHRQDGKWKRQRRRRPETSYWPKPVVVTVTRELAEADGREKQITAIKDVTRVDPGKKWRSPDILTDDVKIVSGRVPDDRRRDRTVGTSTTAGPTGDDRRSRRRESSRSNRRADLRRSNSLRARDEQ